MRYPYELNLVGDARATLRALIPLLRAQGRPRLARADRGRRRRLVADRRAPRADRRRPGQPDADRARALRAAARRTRWSSSDSGSAANWYARHLKMRGDVRGSLSGNLATMGPGVPYAIGAKWAHPDRPAIALVGDGAMQMNGLAEQITIAQVLRGSGADPRLIVAVLHNDDLNQVTWEMRAMEGAPKFAESQSLPDVDYAAFARSLGLQGINVDKADDVGPAWEAALSADRPTRARHPLRPRRPADPAARHVRAGQVHRVGGPARRRGLRRASSSRASSRRCSSTCPAPRTDDVRWALLADRDPADVRTGRFERTLAALTAAGAAITAGGDLPLARRRQLRQQDDVVAGRHRADGHPGRHRRGLLPAGGEDRAAAGQRGDRGQRPAGHLPALARHPPAARRLHAATTWSRGRRCSRRCSPRMVGGMGLLAALLRREGARR